MLFSKIDGLSDLQALRLPPPTSLGNPRQERAQQEMKKPVAPFWEDGEQASLDALACELVPVPAAGDGGADK